MIHGGAHGGYTLTIHVSRMDVDCLGTAPIRREAQGLSLRHPDAEEYIETRSCSSESRDGPEIPAIPKPIPAQNAAEAAAGLSMDASLFATGATRHPADDMGLATIQGIGVASLSPERHPQVLIVCPPPQSQWRSRFSVFHGDARSCWQRRNARPHTNWLLHHLQLRAGAAVYWRSSGRMGSVVLDEATRIKTGGKTSQTHESIAHFALCSPGRARNRLDDLLPCRVHDDGARPIPVLHAHENEDEKARSSYRTRPLREHLSCAICAARAAR